MRRKCKPCQLKGLVCTCMLEMSWVSDSEAAQRAHMTQLQREQDQKVPISDPPNVFKLVRSASFNYWTFLGNYLVTLKLLSCARGDANKAISKPIASVLPRSCLRNKDQMDMNTAVAIFRKELLNALPDDPVVATLIPEHYRYWRQNPADSLLKFPSAITFSPKHSLPFICDEKKSNVFMANLHNPVCVVPVVVAKSFDKKTICKASNFTFALDQKCYKANVEILLELPTEKSFVNSRASEVQRKGCQDHTVNFFIEEESRITYSLGTVQGFQDGNTVAFNSASSLASFGETIFVCDTSDRAVRIITNLTTYRLLGEKMDSFIDFFQLREDSGKEHHHPTSLN
ncbi:unnamed protein product, partial [Porites evermanni]